MLGPELAFVDLGDGSEQLGGAPSITTDKVAEAIEQLSFREGCQ